MQDAREMMKNMRFWKPEDSADGKLQKTKW